MVNLWIPIATDTILVYFCNDVILNIIKQKYKNAVSFSVAMIILNNEFLMNRLGWHAQGQSHVHLSEKLCSLIIYCVVQLL